MAFLLGTESCIQSLRSDLSDIQETIDLIIQSSGPQQKCYSWKSPDKLIGDVNIKDLMERFTFGRDEVDNQVAHYSLLELIIDRLLWLAFISTNQVDATLSTTENTVNGGHTRLVAGLVVKKYWRKFSNLCATTRQLNSQSKTAQVKERAEDSTRAAPFTAKRRDKAADIAGEVHSQSVQTNETSFVPCEACARVQANLKQNADQLINMCHYQDIVSQVGKLRASLHTGSGWLNGADLERWLTEQDKDLGKVARQLEFVCKNNELLKAKLAESEAAQQKALAAEKTTKKTLKEEQELRGIQMKQYEKKLTEQRAELQARIAKLESERDQLLTAKDSVEQKHESLAKLNESNEKIIVELTETNTILSDEVKIKNNEHERLQKLEEERPVLVKELECIRKEIAEKAAELGEDRSKVENLIRSEQSLRSKHEVALETLDRLQAASDALKKRTDYADEEKRALLDSMRAKDGQLEALAYDNEILQNSINSLKQETQKLRSNELLLLKYPDLYGPMDHLSEQEPSVLDDMTHQIDANRHRIALIEALNRKLENSLRKLKETTGHHQRHVSSNSLFDAHPHINDSSQVADQSNYFMKQPDTSSRRSSISSMDSKPARPYPLYKLESELDDEETRKQPKAPPLQQELWSQEDSYQSAGNERIYELPPQPERQRATPLYNHNTSKIE